MFGKLFLLSLLTVAADDTGNAPTDTLDPIQSTDQLLDIFRNCEFSAALQTIADPPQGTGFILNADMASWICADATLLRSSLRTRIFDERTRVGSGKASEDFTEMVETRWTRGGSRIQSHLYYILGTGTKRWLDGAVLSIDDEVKFNAILDYPKDGPKPIHMWDGLIIGDFVGDIDLVSGITFLDMVTDGGRRGFHLRTVNWARNDHTSITYHFASSSYGSCSVTFRRVNDTWMPERFEIVRTGDDRTYVAASGTDNRLKINPMYVDFSNTPSGLDRIETIYEITYDHLPKSIQRTERRQYRGDESIVSSQQTICIS